MQFCEIIAHVIELMFLAVQGESSVNLPVARNLINLFKVPVQPLVVIVGPRPTFLEPAPRQVAQDFPAPCELVQGELSFEVRVVFKDEPYIVYGCLYRAGLLIQLQVLRPVQVFVLICISPGKVAEIVYR